LEAFTPSTLKKELGDQMLYYHFSPAFLWRTILKGKLKKETGFEAATMA
jgi:hypothetical protein